MSYPTNETTPRHSFLKRVAQAGTGAAVALVAALTLPLAANAASAPAAEEIATAQTQLNEAITALDTARNDNDTATAEHTTTSQKSIALKDQAQQAHDVADEATRGYIRLLRENNPADAIRVANALAAGNEKKLLDGVVAETETTFLDNTNTLSDHIAQYRTGAALLTDKSLNTEYTASTIPVDEHRTALANAENEVTLKNGHLNHLKTEEARAIAEAEAAKTPKAANGEEIRNGWVKPATGSVSDSYGPRPDKPVPGVNPFHKGTDIAASCGAPIVAATAGKVIEAETQGSYGNWMLLQHDNGTQTGYAHIAPNGYTATVGDTVNAGQQIAKVGTTGASTGCHLHLEIRKNGDRINPETHLQEKGVTL